MNLYDLIESHYSSFFKDEEKRSCEESWDKTFSLYNESFDAVETLMKEYVNNNMSFRHPVILSYHSDDDFWYVSDGTTRTTALFNLVQQGIVEKHDAVLDVVSTMGEGSTTCHDYSLLTLATVGACACASEKYSFCEFSVKFCYQDNALTRQEHENVFDSLENLFFSQPLNSDYWLKTEGISADFSSREIIFSFCVDVDNNMTASDVNDLTLMLTNHFDRQIAYWIEQSRSGLLIQWEFFKD